MASSSGNKATPTSRAGQDPFDKGIEPAGHPVQHGAQTGPDERVGDHDAEGADGSEAGFDPRSSVHRDPRVPPDVALEGQRSGPVETPVHDWQQPLNMEAPKPRPGYRQRWIRAAMFDGSPDGKNLSRRGREGWRPRDPRTIPQGHLYPKMAHSTFGDVISIEGMILMELPERNAKARDKWVADKRDAQTQSIDEDLLKVQDDRVPFQQTRTTRAVLGRRKPQVADDE